MVLYGVDVRCFMRLMFGSSVDLRDNVVDVGV